MASMGVTLSTAARPLPLPLGEERGLDLTRARSLARLDAVCTQAPRLQLDESSRFVFFSDLHRGDRSPTDSFAPNSDLFVRVLEDYYQQGYTYVEVGDGDELWKNRDLAAIARSYPKVFALLGQLHREGRLRLILGNHDIASSLQAASAKAGMPVIEGLVLRHALSGRELLVAHGHQADMYSDALYRVARWGVRHVWRPLQLLGAGKRRDGNDNDLLASLAHGYDRSSTNQVRIEQRLRHWIAQTTVALLCGHTHHPAFPRVGELPYFNTGTGVVPGSVTGIEIQDDRIMLVRWTRQRGQQPQRQPLSAALQLGVAL